MENDFTITEVRLIQNMLAKASDEEIAFLIEKPVEMVRRKIDELTGGGAKKSYRQLQEEKRLHKEIEATKRRQQKQLKKINKKQSEKVTKVWRDNRLKYVKEETFETKEVDYSQLRTVRINAKTIIYIKPGQDPEQARKKYLSLLNKN